MQFHICNLPNYYKEYKHLFSPRLRGTSQVAEAAGAPLQGCTGKERRLSPATPTLPRPQTCFIYISSIPAGMHTGSPGISDPELNCCRAEQETWQVLDEAELLCKCSNFSESMNLKRSFKGTFLNSFCEWHVVTTSFPKEFLYPVVLLCSWVLCCVVRVDWWFFRFLGQQFGWRGQPHLHK